QSSNQWRDHADQVPFDLHPPDVDREKHNNKSPAPNGVYPAMIRFVCLEGLLELCKFRVGRKAKPAIDGRSVINVLSEHKMEQEQPRPRKSEFDLVLLGHRFSNLSGRGIDLIPRLSPNRPFVHLADPLRVPE